MEAKTIKKTIHVRTNADEVEEKVDKLKQLMEEANSIIQELASMDLEVHFDI